MSDIPSLLSRVRAASGPDRELDADIWRALCWEHHSHEIAKGTPFTGSIDAAVALVERALPEWCYSIGKNCAIMWDDERIVETEAASNALALIAALLAALEQKESAG